MVRARRARPEVTWDLDGGALVDLATRSAYRIVDEYCCIDCRGAAYCKRRALWGCELVRTQLGRFKRALIDGNLGVWADGAVVVRFVDELAVAARRVCDSCEDAPFRDGGVTI